MHSVKEYISINKHISVFSKWKWPSTTLTTNYKLTTTIKTQSKRWLNLSCTNRAFDSLALVQRNLKWIPIHLVGESSRRRSTWNRNRSPSSSFGHINTFGFSVITKPDHDRSEHFRGNRRTENLPKIGFSVKTTSFGNIETKIVDLLRPRNGPTSGLTLFSDCLKQTIRFKSGSLKPMEDWSWEN